jgi:hypothetical protein
MTNYSGDQAVEKGIRALLNHPRPLREGGDVDTLRSPDGGTVGQGTRDKIKEILALGFLPRNKELENNLQHQCVQLVIPALPIGESPPFPNWGRTQRDQHWGPYFSSAIKPREGHSVEVAPCDHAIWSSSWGKRDHYTSACFIFYWSRFQVSVSLLVARVFPCILSPCNPICPPPPILSLILSLSKTLLCVFARVRSPPCPHTDNVHACEALCVSLWGRAQARARALLHCLPSGRGREC